MISVILYGRNDNYGYNLHKRAAISLNCIAEILGEDSDEIIFVDYNTPDDLPTFPEAIADTLTPRARARLRVLRVRPSIHERYKSRTHLPALEPVARNVGARRSNPSNRWILSTNTDLVFVTRKQSLLNDVVGNLSGGLYHAPRIEIPEAMWESLDRKDPRATIRSVREWGWTLHLNEIVYGNDTILYDGPGDFQLLERRQLFDIHGFDEEMLLGWHVDSNLAKRMELSFGKVGDLGEKVYAYHCDHTRQATPMHSHIRIENDWQRFVADLTRSELPEQADHWGCAHDDIEEIRLTGGQSHLHVTELERAIGKRLRQPSIAHYTGDSASGASYDARHIVPFLIDLLCSYSKDTVVGWCGTRIDTLRLFTRAWNALGFERPVLIDSSLVDSASFATVLDTRLVTRDMVQANANVFVFDFGLGADTAPHQQDNVAKRFTDVVGAERQRFAEGYPLRKFVTIGAVNNEYEKLIGTYLGAGYVPFSTRIRQGYILLPTQGEQNWLPALEAGTAGLRQGRFITSREGQAGIVAHGGYKHLPPGKYRLTIEFERITDPSAQSYDGPGLAIEVRTASRLFSVHAIEARDLHGSHAFLFDVPKAVGNSIEDTVEVLLISAQPIRFSVRALTLASIEAAPVGDSILQISNWLPFLNAGPSGRRDGSTITALEGRSGYITTGPYWPLPDGSYELTVALIGPDLRKGAENHERLGTVEVASQGHEFASTQIGVRELASGTVRLLFDLANANPEAGPPLIETRIWTSGAVEFSISAVVVRPWQSTKPWIHSEAEHNWLPCLEIGDAGKRDNSSIGSRPDQIGLVFSGFYPNVASGRYRLSAGFTLTATPSNLSDHEPCLQIEINVAARLIALHVLKVGDLRNPPSLIFEVPSSPETEVGRTVEIRATTIQPVMFEVQKLTMLPTKSVDLANSILQVVNWLPFLTTGPSARRNDGIIDIGRGREEIAVFGPYWPLRPGRYVMTAILEEMTSLKGYDPSECLAKADIAIAANEIASMGIRVDDLGQREVRLKFAVPPHAESQEPNLIETRIWTTGITALRLRAVSVRPWFEDDGITEPQLGPAGAWDGKAIKSRPEVQGCIARFGIPFGLEAGPQRFKLDFKNLQQVSPPTVNDPCLVVDLYQADRMLKHEIIHRRDLDRLTNFIFEIPPQIGANPSLELRMEAVAPISIRITNLSIENAIFQESWLPFFRIGSLGVRAAGAITAERGAEGYVFDGPYWPLQAGRFDVCANIELLDSDTLLTDDEAVAILEVAINTDGIANTNIGREQLAAGQVRLSFELPPQTVEAPRLTELRIWTSGRVRFRITSVYVEPWNQVTRLNLTHGEAGQWDQMRLRSLKFTSGCVAIGTPVFNLLDPGLHRLSIDWTMQETNGSSKDPCILIEFSHRGRLFSIQTANSEDLARSRELIFKNLPRTKEFLFHVPSAVVEASQEPIQVRVVALRPLTFAVHEMSIVPAHGAQNTVSAPVLENWLPVLRLAETGQRIGRSIRAEAGVAGYVLDGPYWPLAPGPYELIATFDLADSGLPAPSDALLGIVDVAVNTEQIAKAEILSQTLANGGVRLRFNMPGSDPSDLPPVLETRIWTSGLQPLLVHSMVVRSTRHRAPEELLQ